MTNYLLKPTNSNIFLSETIRPEKSRTTFFKKSMKRTVNHKFYIWPKLSFRNKKEVKSVLRH
jgi:hypothetical protein